MTKPNHKIVAAWHKEYDEKYKDKVYFLSVLNTATKIVLYTCECNNGSLSYTIDHPLFSKSYFYSFTEAVTETERLMTYMFSAFNTEVVFDRTVITPDIPVKSASPQMGQEQGKWIRTNAPESDVPTYTLELAPHPMKFVVHQSVDRPETYLLDVCPGIGITPMTYVGGDLLSALLMAEGMATSRYGFKSYDRTAIAHLFPKEANKKHSLTWRSEGGTKEHSSLLYVDLNSHFTALIFRDIKSGKLCVDISKGREGESTISELKSDTLESALTYAQDRLISEAKHTSEPLTQDMFCWDEIGHLLPKAATTYVWHVTKSPYNILALTIQISINNTITVTRDFDSGKFVVLSSISHDVHIAHPDDFDTLEGAVSFAEYKIRQYDKETNNGERAKFDCNEIEDLLNKSRGLHD
jgi:hypothetical protein